MEASHNLPSLQALTLNLSKQEKNDRTPNSVEKFFDKFKMSNNL